MSVIKRIACMGVVLIIAIIMYYFDIGCPFYNVFGIPCAGCGMTRAFIAVMHLEFQLAFNLHPLVFITPIMFIIFIFGGNIKKKYSITFWSIIGLLFICVYFIKLISVY